jgi:hypothetical protein
MPVDMKRYPADWKAISARIRERDENKCKWCGVPNGAAGYRGPDGQFWTEEMINQVCDGGDPWEGKPYRYVVIVLTVAHLGTPHADGTPGDKHDKMDVRDENLAALCQRCHLRYDIKEHMQNAARTRLAKKQALYVPMFDEEAA